ncbi:MAG: succinate dehydrogenase, cytochrome b556 subunit [Betaproteobacteria bacterium]|nr:succinate dehydrogenase, cytochrome b556 subunit [Betaproteobacteria bacterium]MDE2123282.1 succinate dehydrogenase, cytochrome b556 subunit [Betaproteobacteria bacterium]MDE2187960.1 succinate dehydrogenase, cytochrome b556 subunit [Betaproteobacteria bacterium]MDE2325741.1 succinate dehydrogenase, cytochrome b556 subunit [Betaproteobacteria bacterium]
MPTVHTRKRPEFRNIHISQIAGYRLPLAGLVSILHRVSGALMFFLLPFTLWMLDTSLRSEQSYAQLAQFLGLWPVKLLLLVLFWALAHHLAAGVRHLVMDAFQTVSKEQGRKLAVATFAVSLLATAAFAAHLFVGA